MSYIVKVGSLPISCLYCPCGANGKFSELPKQHGRLIDADYLVGVLQDTLEHYPDKYDDNNALERMIIEACKNYIEHCPTIVEPENNK